MRAALALLGLVTATTGCAATPVVVVKSATPAETVVLLPRPSGGAGALTVTQDAQQRVLDTPYATTRVREAGKLEAGERQTAEQVRRDFGGTLDALPPRPVSFTVYFLDASDDFTPESKQEIPKILKEIAGRPSPEIVVVGHTDRVGALAYNDALSLRRAERVRVQLGRIGIPDAQISVAGRGEREPLVPTDDEVAEPRNRRVEITVR